MKLCHRFHGLVDAYNAGRIAAVRNEPWTSNPFPVDSAHWDSWADGYHDSLAQCAAEAELAREMIAANVPICRVEERLDAREPQPKAVSLFDCLMHFFCRNAAKGRA